MRRRSTKLYKEPIQLGWDSPLAIIRALVVWLRRSDSAQGSSKPVLQHYISAFAFANMTRRIRVPTLYSNRASTSRCREAEYVGALETLQELRGRAVFSTDQNLRL